MSAKLDLDLKNWIELHAQGNHLILSEKFIEVLTFFSKNTYTKKDDKLTHRVNTIIQSFLHLFSDPTFKIPAEHADAYLFLNPVIANLVAISDFDNTDPWLEMVLGQEENFLKIITLYSCRNKLQLDTKILFKAQPMMTSKWWVTCWFSSECFASPMVFNFFQRHLKGIDKTFQLYGPGASAPCFFTTYINSAEDHIFKLKFNEMVQSTLSNVQIISEPEPKHIAVATSKWFNNSAVYKCLCKFVETLKPEYKLTLIHLGKSREDLETSIFDNVINIEFDDGALSLSSLQANTFNLIYYPDIGMDYEGKFLSNLRIAPIQVMGYGHPVSTFGSKIDYFITGQTVEHPDLAEKNFTERMVLIPGMGVHPVYPSYVPQAGTKPRWHEETSGKIILNCSWGSRKINYPLLQTLIKIQENSEKNLLFRFFPGTGISLMNAFLPVKKDLENIFGKESVSLIPQVPYDLYMDLLSVGNFSIDAFPFGGFNTVIDSLMCNLPVITWEGDRSFNRIASAFMRQMGLDECIARNEQEYVEKAVELINCESSRIKLSRKIQSLDLKSLAFDKEQPKYFKKAIDFLIQEHQFLKNQSSKKPIIIQ